jgi:hypothetical protein
MPSLKEVLTFVSSHIQWLLLAYLLVSAWITRRICGRWAREAREKKQGGAGDSESTGARWFGYFIVFMLFGFLSMAAVLMPVAIGERVSVFVTGSRYEANISGFNSREERVTREDSNKRRYSETVTMHTPVYAFKLADGRQVEKEGDYSSESEPDVGDTQAIFYNAATGRLVTASFGVVAMLSFGALFSFLAMVGLYATLRYAFNRSTGGALRLLGQSLLGLVLPLAMAGMAGGLGYYVFERIATDRRDDDPLWVVCIAGFFCLTLLLVMAGYLKQSRDEAGPGMRRGRRR